MLGEVDVELRSWASVTMGTVPQDLLACPPAAEVSRLKCAIPFSSPVHRRRFVGRASESSSSSISSLMFIAVGCFLFMIALSYHG
jgi:hypothetical protein